MHNLLSSTALCEFVAHPSPLRVTDPHRAVEPGRRTEPWKKLYFYNPYSSQVQCSGERHKLERISSRIKMSSLGKRS